MEMPQFVLNIDDTGVNTTIGVSVEGDAVFVSLTTCRTDKQIGGERISQRCITLEQTQRTQQAALF